jgi:hypothetical protein
MKELIAKLDAENYESWEMRQIFTGPLFMRRDAPIVVMNPPTSVAVPGKRWHLRDRRGRFTTPGKPEW